MQWDTASYLVLACGSRVLQILPKSRGVKNLVHSYLILIISPRTSEPFLLPPRVHKCDNANRWITPIIALLLRPFLPRTDELNPLNRRNELRHASPAKHARSNVTLELSEYRAVAAPAENVPRLVSWLCGSLVEGKYRNRNVAWVSW